VSGSPIRKLHEAQARLKISSVKIFPSAQKIVRFI
jgi:hypothetical protein